MQSLNQTKLQFNLAFENILKELNKYENDLKIKEKQLFDKEISLNVKEKDVDNKKESLEDFGSNKVSLVRKYDKELKDEKIKTKILEDQLELYKHKIKELENENKKLKQNVETKVVKQSIVEQNNETKNVEQNNETKNVEQNNETKNVEQNNETKNVEQNNETKNIELNNETKNIELNNDESSKNDSEENEFEDFELKGKIYLLHRVSSKLYKKNDDGSSGKLLGKINKKGKFEKILEESL